MKHSHIHPKLVIPMVLYGLLTTLAGIVAVIISLETVVQGNRLDVLDIVTWIVFVGLFWLAFAEKPLGNVLVWKVLSPLLIVSDVMSIIVLSAQESPNVLDTIFWTVLSIIFSLPLYTALHWYAYRFMPKVSKTQHH